jgi:hypothetical protein
MDAVETALRRIRIWFVIWFIAEAIAGTAVAAWVLEGLGRQPLLRHALGGMGAAGTVLAGFGVSLVLLLLAMAVLDALQRLQPWARSVMLVIGWITVVSAALGLLSFSAASALLDSLGAFGAGRSDALSAVNLLTRAADLVFWAWVIYMLQLKPDVREAFARPCAPSPPAPTWQARP